MYLKFALLSLTLCPAVTRTIAYVSVLLLLFILLPPTNFACASSKISSITIPAPTAGSCNNATSGFCNEFTGSSYKIERVKKSCKEGQGVMYLVGSCPTEKRVGTCIVYKGKNTESNYRYYSNFPGYGIKPVGGVAVAAETQCTKLKGEWIPN